MKPLLKYFKGLRYACVLAPLFKLTEALLELFVPVLVARIIDVGIAGNDRGYILKNVLFIIALGALGLGLSVTAQYFSAKAATGFSRRVRDAAFCSIQGFSYSQLDRAGIPTLITRLTGDVDRLQSGVNLTLRLFLRRHADRLARLADLRGRDPGSGGHHLRRDAGGHPAVHKGAGASGYDHEIRRGRAGRRAGHPGVRRPGPRAGFVLRRGRGAGEASEIHRARHVSAHARHLYRHQRGDGAADLFRRDPRGARRADRRRGGRAVQLYGQDFG